MLTLVIPRLVAMAHYCLSSVLSHFFECLPHDPLGSLLRKEKIADCLGYFLLSRQELIFGCGGKGPAQLNTNNSDTCHCPDSAGCTFHGDRAKPLALGDSSHPAF